MLGLILAALTPIIFVVALGWLAGGTKMMPDGASGVLARFVIQFALPFTLFLAAATAKPADMFHPAFLGALAAGLFGMYILGFAVSRISFGRTTREASLEALGCSFPNMAYCGPPVLLAVIGAQGLLPVVVGNLLVTILLVPVTLVVLAGGEGGAKEGHGVASAVWHALCQPLVFLPAAGALIAILGVPLPKLVVDAVDEVGRAAAGAALFTLGLILSQTRLSLDREILFNVAAKNILQPTVMLGVGLALGLDAPMLKMVLLTGVLPSATEVPALSIAHGTYAQKAAATTMVSTIFAIVSISIGVAIAARLGR